MIPRLLILIGLVLAGFSALFYLVTRVHRFRFSLALARGRHGWSWVISVLAAALPAAVIWLAWGYMNAIICLLHLALFWLLSDALFALLKRLHGKPWRRYYAGLTALLLTAAYLSAGWVQAHHVWQTNYIIHTDKPVGTLRVALIADSHMGTTFHADGFARPLVDAPLGKVRQVNIGRKRRRRLNQSAESRQKMRCSVFSFIQFRYTPSTA